MCFVKITFRDRMQQCIKRSVQIRMMRSLSEWLILTIRWSISMEFEARSRRSDSASIRTFFRWTAVFVSGTLCGSSRRSWKRDRYIGSWISCVIRSKRLPCRDSAFVSSRIFTARRTLFATWFTRFWKVSSTSILATTSTCIDFVFFPLQRYQSSQYPRRFQRIRLPLRLRCHPLHQLL